jgi:hypothetical protein
MFITSTFNHVGRLGNQLFQIATNVGFARQFGHDSGITPWDYQHAFQLKTIRILEPNPHPKTSFLLYERGAKDWFRGLLEDYDFLRHSSNDIWIDLR